MGKIGYGTIECPSCGHPHDKEYKSCPECGVRKQGTHVVHKLDRHHSIREDGREY